MEREELARLEEAVLGSPNAVGARLRFGLALLENGRKEQAASELRLAAKLGPDNPYVAVAAALAMARCGSERDAALLLSTQVRPARGPTRLAEIERSDLEQLMDHPDSYVRYHLAKGMGRLRLVDCREALERACGDRSFAVRSAAVASLELIMAH